MALPVPANGGVFTYRLREGAIEPGRRVLVPLGRRTATGVVLGPAGSIRGELRDVLRVLDDEPLLPPDVLRLARWAAAHYLAPLGLAVRAALPPGIDLRQELSAVLTPEGEALLEGEQQTLLPAGREAATRTRQLLRAVREGRALRTAQLRALAKRGLVALSASEPRPRVQAPQVELAAAVPEARPPARSPRQAEVLAWLLARDPAGVPVEELLAAFPGARAHLRKLAARRLVSLRKEPAGAASIADAPWGTLPARETAAQSAALAELRTALDSRRYAPFLLDGVTGSGKTHVYMEAIARARAQRRGALALVPEIALTPQLAGRFRARFGEDVAVLHSGLTERERLSEWHRVRGGAAGVVVGTRSAVFAPVRDLGIVVVDEEHEPSYKQEDRLRYHARDLALVRARDAGAVVVLGSATPSLETLRRAGEGRLSTLRLPERVDGRALPAVEIVDRKTTLRGPGDPSLLTPALADALRRTAARGEQAILFLNKRGHVRSLLCRSCGAALGCPNCSVALVLHRASGTALRCHLCGHEELPRPCAACGSDDLFPLSAGTERVEEELRALLPRARIARLDRDSAGGPGKAASVLARFARRELDVLVGTQMVAKGHDFPGVTLVGALDADGPLHLPDYRAAERCVQLLAQVAGRAGRGEQPGRVLLQAFRTAEPAVAAAAAHDYHGFARSELARREALCFPPYARLCAVRLQGNVEARVQAAAERLAGRARDLQRSRGGEVDVLGPAPAPIARLRGKHRFQLLLRARDHGPIHRLCRALFEVPLPPGVELSADVDPVGLL
ncbi:MAG TPA: primosomal protein N' [Myxococcales bacterium]|nr:primosomal protein N' [Myxococcales bacterium]